MAKKLKWGTIENLDNLINEYFDIEPIPSIVGLRYYLGIGEMCWQYYVNDRWRTHNKSDEEIDVANKKQEETDIDQLFEEWQELSPKPFLIEEFSQYSRDENDVLKSRVSLSFKRGRDRVEIFIVKQLQLSKNPAGSIFYAKSALKYRENDPVSSNVDSGPTFNVLIQLAAPTQKPVIEIQKVNNTKMILDI